MGLCLFQVSLFNYRKGCALFLFNSAVVENVKTRGHFCFERVKRKIPSRKRAWGSPARIRISDERRCFGSNASSNIKTAFARVSSIPWLHWGNVCLHPSLWSWTNNNNNIYADRWSHDILCAFFKPTSTSNEGVTMSAGLSPPALLRSPDSLELICSHLLHCPHYLRWSADPPSTDHKGQMPRTSTCREPEWALAELFCHIQMWGRTLPVPESESPRPWIRKRNKVLNRLSHLEDDWNPWLQHVQGPLQQLHNPASLRRPEKVGKWTLLKALNLNETALKPVFERYDP